MNIKDLVGNTDIYLIDQILKGTYLPNEILLDAGCGGGRNLHWFYQNEFDIYAVDATVESVQFVKQLYPTCANNFQQALLEKLPYEEQQFNHVICCAVLHFATGEQHFRSMFSELVRVLKKGGTLFIRMTSTFGMSKPFQLIADGVYQLHDQSTRFLLTPSLLNDLLEVHQLQLAEPLKTTNVNDLRCMSTLVFRKVGI